jgi:monoterpene epsilon-lactone hydrolase
MYSWQLFALEAMFRNPLKGLVNIRRDLRAIRRIFNRSTILFKPLRHINFHRFMINHLTAEWLEPANKASEVVVLYLHGGGYCLGSTESHHAYLTYFSHITETPVLAINYRLAPEHPFPAALEDSITAYQWLLEHKKPHQKIVLAGESAGGGLCLSTLLKLRELRLPMPAAAVCISPWLDLTHTGKSLQYNRTTDAILKLPEIEEVAEFYYENLDPHDPLISPLYGDFTGLPPLLIQASSSELLLSDALRLKAKAEQQGVDVCLEMWKNMPHAWPYFAPVLPEAKEALKSIKAFLDGIAHSSQEDPMNPANDSQTHLEQKGKDNEQAA